MQTAVLIVSWESDQYIESAIASVARQLAPGDRIIVWDNASSTASRQAVQEVATRWPQVSLHLSDENLGFAAGNNAAAACCPDADTLLTLNPDAVLQPGALAAMLDALRNDPTLASVGAIQLNEDGSRIDGLGDAYHYSGLVWRQGYGRPVSELAGMLADDKSPVTPIFAPCAAVALYRRSAFDQAGGFDAAYFCYCEDNDLGFRLRLLGWHHARANRAKALHVGSTSLGKDSAFSIWHGQRNLVWTFIKNMPGALVVPLSGIHLAANLLMILVYTLRGQGKTVVTAKLAALKGIGPAYRMRRCIQRQRRISAWQVWRAMHKSLVR